MIDFREHDFFYLKDKKYFKKPKYTYSVAWKFIKKYRQKKLIFADIGVGNSSQIIFLKKKKTKWNFIGTDIKKKLILHARKITNCNIIFDDINKKKTTLKADIINVGGVLNCYDNPKLFLDNIILSLKAD